MKKLLVTLFAAVIIVCVAAASIQSSKLGDKLGKVLKGCGNNDRTSEEGAMTANAFGTYLHGSLLPKNPDFADELILRGMRRHHGDDAQLGPLDDDLERGAAAAAAKRA